MSAIPINLKIEKGTDFFATFTLKDEYGSYIDLSSYAVSAKYSHNYSSSTKYNFLVNVPNPTTGGIEIRLPSSETVSLKLPRYVYTITITAPLNSGGKKTRVIEGIIEVSPGVV